MLYTFEDQDHLSDTMSVDLDAKRWLQSLQKLEASGIEQAFEACHPRLRPALKKIQQEKKIKNRDGEKGYDPESVLNAYHARYPDSYLEHQVMPVEYEGHTVVLSIFRPSGDGPVGGRPCLYYIHGGGFVGGNRGSGMTAMFPLIHDHDMICVSVEYRLASEWRAPAPLKDCYHGLVEVWKQRESIGINDRLLLVGRSAGANLAIGVAILVRDSKNKEKPQIRGQILSYPMLDHTSRMALEKFSYSPAWTQEECTRSWSQYLGDERQTVTIYTVPNSASVEDLTGLPPTLIDIAEVDGLSTEARHFGDNLKAAGNDVEINTWNGLFYCGDGAIQGQHNPFSANFQARSTWVRRRLRDL